MEKLILLNSEPCTPAKRPLATFIDLRRRGSVLRTAARISSGETLSGFSVRSTRSKSSEYRRSALSPSRFTLPTISFTSSLSFGVVSDRPLTSRALSRARFWGTFREDRNGLTLTLPRRRSHRAAGPARAHARLDLGPAFSELKSAAEAHSSRRPC